MSVQIRNGVFETNSSSMHSIAVRKQHGKIASPETERVYIHKGSVSIYSDDLNYERYPFRMLYTLMDKAKYAVASYLGGYQYLEKDSEKAKEFLEGELYPVIRKYFPDFVKFDFRTDWERVYIDPDDPEDAYCHWDEGVHYTGDDSPSGYSLIKEDGTKTPLVEDKEHYVEVVDYGNVDHQSTGLLQGFLKKSGVSLEDFLTDSAYVVVIDGDEYCDFCKYLACGLIHLEDFEAFYPSSDYFWGSELSDEDKKKVEITPVQCDD